MQARPDAEALVAPGAHIDRARIIAYWTCTVIIAGEMAAGSMWDLRRIHYTRAILGHLGYPMYLLFILGAWKLPCAIALVVPRFPRLKEWAYAGAVFNYTGAVASHLLAGDHASEWMAPLVFAVIALASWALRSESRRLRVREPPEPARIVAWIAPLATVAAFVLVGLLAVPK